jgi:hypothetical protein
LAAVARVVLPRILTSRDFFGCAAQDDEQPRCALAARDQPIALGEALDGGESTHAPDVGRVEHRKHLASAVQWLARCFIHADPFDGRRDARAVAETGLSALRVIET